MHGEFRVEDFKIQPHAGTISREGRIAKVEQKAMAVIACLARNAGEVIDKEQVMREVWPESSVSDEVLSNTVWKLRHIFGDDPKEPRFIETIQKKGYRLIAHVSFQELLRPAMTRGLLTVGHEAERAELQECFASALGGQGLLVCVTGEAGIGKTTFIERFLRQDRLYDCSIGRGKCSERLAGTGAYLPILEAIESLTRAGADDDLVRLLKLFAPCWYAQVFPFADDSMAFSTQALAPSQERMKRELTAFLREVSDLRPLLLFF